MKVAVVGLGLIGGSIALDLKSRKFATKVYGVDANVTHSEDALLLGLVDLVCSLENACERADLVVLATPVSSISKILPKVLDLISKETTVTDVGSTKIEICQSVEGHKNRKRFVASHPMSGTEFSGPSAAHEGLFAGKAAVICDSKQSDAKSVQIVSDMYEALNMRLVHMTSKEHDLHTAYVSHLSHISSFVLANTVLDKERDVETLFDLASGGFESTVRLAKSSPEMWNPIFEQNQENITEALGEYIDQLKRFHKSLSSRNFEKTKDYMEKANRIRRVLVQIKGKGSANAKSKRQEKKET